MGFGASSLGERERNKGKGRIGIVVGAMYLLAGRWPDAAKELVQSAALARASSDYLWHAKALDYILVCLLMFAWAGMDFRVSFHQIDETYLYKMTAHCDKKLRCPDSRHLLSSLRETWLELIQNIQTEAI